MADDIIEIPRDLLRRLIHVAQDGINGSPHISDVEAVDLAIEYLDPAKEEEPAV